MKRPHKNKALTPEHRFNRWDYHRIRSLNVRTKPVHLLPDMVRFLKVCYDSPDDDFKFTAGSVWKRHEGQWRCVEAGPILKWMKGMEPAAAKLELARRGCSWEWVKELEFLVDPAQAGVVAPVDNVSHRMPKHEAQAIADMAGVAQ